MSTPDLRSPQDDELDARIRAALDAQGEALDAATASRLTRARWTAVEAAATARPRSTVRSGGWLALASAGALAVWLALPGPAAPPAPVEAETFALLAEPEADELLGELDYYAYLLEQEADAR